MIVTIERFGVAGVPLPLIDQEYVLDGMLGGGVPGSDYSYQTLRRLQYLVTQRDLVFDAEAKYVVTFTPEASP